MTSDSDELLYRKLVAAMRGIADGKGMSERVGLPGDVRDFAISEVLSAARFLKGDFAGDHVDFVKKAFAEVGKTYPGDNIAACVATMLT
jgi:hypothetical protein